MTRRLGWDVQKDEDLAALRAEVAALRRRAFLAGGRDEGPRCTCFGEYRGKPWHEPDCPARDEAPGGD